MESKITISNTVNAICRDILAHFKTFFETQFSSDAIHLCNQDCAKLEEFVVKADAKFVPYKEILLSEIKLILQLFTEVEKSKKDINSLLKLRGDLATLIKSVIYLAKLEVISNSLIQSIERVISNGESSPGERDKLLTQLNDSLNSFIKQHSAHLQPETKQKLTHLYQDIDKAVHSSKQPNFRSLLDEFNTKKSQLIKEMVIVLCTATSNNTNTTGTPGSIRSPSVFTQSNPSTVSTHSPTLLTKNTPLSSSANGSDMVNRVGRSASERRPNNTITSPRKMTVHTTTSGGSSTPHADSSVVTPPPRSFSTFTSSKNINPISNSINNNNSNSNPSKVTPSTVQQQQPQQPQQQKTTTNSPYSSRMGRSPSTPTQTGKIYSNPPSTQTAPPPPPPHQKVSPITPLSHSLDANPSVTKNNNSNNNNAASSNSSSSPPAMITAPTLNFLKKAGAKKPLQQEEHPETPSKKLVELLSDDEDELKSPPMFNLPSLNSSSSSSFGGSTSVGSLTPSTTHKQPHSLFNSPSTNTDSTSGNNINNINNISNINNNNSQEGNNDGSNSNTSTPNSIFRRPVVYGSQTPPITTNFPPLPPTPPLNMDVTTSITTPPKGSDGLTGIERLRNKINMLRSLDPNLQVYNNGSSTPTSNTTTAASSSTATTNSPALVNKLNLSAGSTKSNELDSSSSMDSARQSSISNVEGDGSENPPPRGPKDDEGSERSSSNSRADKIRDDEGDEGASDSSSSCSSSTFTTSRDETIITNNNNSNNSSGSNIMKPSLTREVGKVGLVYHGIQPRGNATTTTTGTTQQQQGDTSATSKSLGIRREDSSSSSSSSALPEMSTLTLSPVSGSSGSGGATTTTTGLGTGSGGGIPPYVQSKIPKVVKVVSTWFPKHWEELNQERKKYFEREVARILSSYSQNAQKNNYNNSESTSIQQSQLPNSTTTTNTSGDTNIATSSAAQPQTQTQPQPSTSSQDKTQSKSRSNKNTLTKAKTVSSSSTTSGGSGNGSSGGSSGGDDERNPNKRKKKETVSSAGKPKHQRKKSNAGVNNLIVSNSTGVITKLPTKKKPSTDIIPLEIPMPTTSSSSTNTSTDNSTTSSSSANTGDSSAPININDYPLSQQNHVVTQQLSGKMLTVLSKIQSFVKEIQSADAAIIHSTTNATVTTTTTAAAVLPLKSMASDYNTAKKDITKEVEELNSNLKEIHKLILKHYNPNLSSISPPPPPPSSTVTTAPASSNDHKSLTNSTETFLNYDGIPSTSSSTSTSSSSTDTSKYHMNIQDIINIHQLHDENNNIPPSLGHLICIKVKILNLIQLKFVKCNQLSSQLLSSIILFPVIGENSSDQGLVSNSDVLHSLTIINMIDELFKNLLEDLFLLISLQNQINSSETNNNSNNKEDKLKKKKSKVESAGNHALYVTPLSSQIPTNQLSDSVWNGSSNLLDESDTTNERFRGGTINNLIIRLTFTATDKDFINTFLNAYSHFISPNDLFEKFLDRYNIPKTENNEEVSFIKMRVLNVMNQWVKHHHDLIVIDNKLVEKIRNFAHMTSNDYKSASTLILNELDSHAKTNFDHVFSNSMKNLNCYWWSGVSTYRFLLCYTEEQICEQLSFIDAEIFRRIEVSELLGRKWSNPKQHIYSQNVIEFMRRIDHLSKWTATFILLHEKLKERTKALRRMITISKLLLDTGNLHSFIGVMSGLSSSFVRRLKLTWDELPAKYQHTFKDSLQLTNVSSSFKALREVMKDMKGKIIPYLGMYLSDISSVEDKLQNTVVYNNVPMINISKYSQINTIIKSIQQYQKLCSSMLSELTSSTSSSSSSSLKKDPLYSFLSILPSVSHQELNVLSLEREPDKPNKQTDV
eukprot:TRINITY_DN1598_c2_g1_i2.p1 TRINITY_DN1598_c2_g1~~TRINITY_DN1598_c2_g1_i2.p1  ORF type:complete len:1849 (-),score=631.57 TRINITY_DN1598_c2_g1_i2:101-5647(-)